MQNPIRLQPYEDRADAAAELARTVRDRMPPPARGTRFPSAPDLVVGLCRGGVPIARGVARRLGLPADFLVVRKIALPGNPELALGALAEGGPEGAEPVAFLNAGLLPHAPAGLLAAARARARAELEERIRRYRAGRPPCPVAGKHVLLVDDGAATGATMRAAIASVRARGAARISVALPVAPEETVRELEGDADAVVCAWCPAFFLSVGTHYRHFPAVDDTEVLAGCAERKTSEPGGVACAQNSAPARDNRPRCDSG
jgi:predicted phosphoribosyltransferase